MLTACGPGADADVNWEESQSYASASSTALSARSARDTATSRPGSAAAPLPGSWLRPGSGAAAANLSDLDDNPFAAGSSAGAGLGSGQHEALYDEDGFLIDSAEASRRTSRASAGGDARSGAAEVPPSAAARISRWSVDSSGRGSGASDTAAGAAAGEPRVSPGAAGGALAGGTAAAMARGGAAEEPLNAERASEDDSEEDFLVQVRSNDVRSLSRIREVRVKSLCMFLVSSGLP